MLDLSSMESVFLVHVTDGIDEPTRLVCWTRTEAEAVEVIGRCEIERATRPVGMLDPQLRADADPQYAYERVDRWPAFGERVDRRDATGVDLVR